MKTFRNLLLTLALMLGLNQLHAQTCLWSYASSTSLTAEFNIYLFDSAAIANSSYYWEFGDGDTAQAFAPSHTYAQSGTYNACFHFTSATCTYDTCFNVAVDQCNFNPIVAHTQTGLSAAFSVTNAPVGANYFWQFETLSGTLLDTSTNSNPVFGSNTAGSYRVLAIVYTSTGCGDSVSLVINLTNPCAPHIYTSSISNTGLDVQFWVSPSDSLNPSTYSYAWQFGDGGTASVFNPTHTYAAYGNYNVCVAVSGAGCYDSVCQPITIAIPPPPNYYIFGNLNYSGSGNCNSTTYLIREDSAGHLALVSEYSAFVDSNCAGSFFFYVPAGTYYLKGALDSNDLQYANYLPTYYGDELLWANATPINLTATTSGLNINLIAGINPGGPGFVGGYVSQGAGLAIGGNNEHRGVGDPLPNIQINLLTDNDVPVAYTYTDANGRYTFSNLALGTYKVYAEEINKVPQSMNVTLTANNPSQDNVDVSINSNTAVTGINDLFELHVEGLFPNPATDKSVLSVSLKQGATADMRITDMSGRVLRTEKLKLNAGTNRIDINLTDRPAGMYLISLTGEAGKKVLRVTKAN